MQQLDGGFPIGPARRRWGMTIAEYCSLTGRERTDPDRTIIVGCRNALGLDTICAELTAPRHDRPVTQLRYELAPIAGDPTPDPTVFVRPLTELFGRAREIADYELPDNGDLSGSVRHYTGWDAGDFSVGISLYGAPRQNDYGFSPGCLWLTWSSVKAAQPYLAAWKSRADELAAREPADLAGFCFGAAQIPALGSGGAKGDAVRREAENVLYCPELLPTPAPISALAGDHGAVFWRFGDRNWCASTAWDTLILDTGSTIDIAWNDIAPAKGGGFSEIAIGRWTVRDWHGSLVVRDAVAHLETMTGQRVNRRTGYDC